MVGKGWRCLILSNVGFILNHTERAMLIHVFGSWQKLGCTLEGVVGPYKEGVVGPYKALKGLLRPFRAF